MHDFTTETPCDRFLCFNIVLTTTGPMGKDVDSLALFMQAILCDDMFSLDPTVPPLSFNEQVSEASVFILAIHKLHMKAVKMKEQIRIVLITYNFSAIPFILHYKLKISTRLCLNMFTKLTSNNTLKA